MKHIKSQIKTSHSGHHELTQLRSRESELMAVLYYWSMVRVKFVFHLVVVIVKRVVHCIVEFGLSVGYVDRLLMWLFAFWAGEGREVDGCVRGAVVKQDSVRARDGSVGSLVFLLTACLCENFGRPFSISRPKNVWSLIKIFIISQKGYICTGQK